MSPLLTTFAGASSWAFGFETNASGSSDLELISTQTLSSTTTGLQFTSIPQTYKHLQLRIVASSGTVSNLDSMLFYFNTDTGSNYSYHSQIGAAGSAVGSITSSASTAATDITLPSLIAGQGAGAAPAFTGAVIDLMDYANTTSYKTVRALAGFFGASSGSNVGYIGHVSGNWRSTAAISTITIDYNGNLYQVGSRFSLYGIKG